MRTAALLTLLAAPLQAMDLGPPPVFPPVDEDRAKLGQLLFYDPILSGNRNISCGTCHHPRFGTSDGVSLSIGEGGIGLGPERVHDAGNLPEQRLPRNAPGLWNLGAEEFQVMFHDGRLEADTAEPNGIRTPLGPEMVEGFDSVLSAQSMFPVLSGDEMAGHYSENDVSQAVRLGFLTGPGGAWDLLAQRVENIPEYKAAFAKIAPDAEISFPLISNVIADFIRFEWRADQSPFDRAMSGLAPLEDEAERGRILFYGAAGCGSCHSGWFQTDHRFHAIGLPQIGPGKSARFENHARDEGRLRVTGLAADAYAFRTPSLRNVTLTGPYGHNGAYASLRDMIEHHSMPRQRLETYKVTSAVLPYFSGVNDVRSLRDQAEKARIAAAISLPEISISDHDISALIAFLQALEDPAERLGVPDVVPSGLPVDR